MLSWLFNLFLHKTLCLKLFWVLAAEQFCLPQNTVLHSQVQILVLSVCCTWDKCRKMTTLWRKCVYYWGLFAFWMIDEGYFCFYEKKQQLQFKKKTFVFLKKRHSGSVSVVEAGSMELVELPLSLSFSQRLGSSWYKSFLQSRLIISQWRSKHVCFWFPRYSFCIWIPVHGCVWWWSMDFAVQQAGSAWSHCDDRYDGKRQFVRPLGCPAGVSASEHSVARNVCKPSFGHITVHFLSCPLPPSFWFMCSFSIKRVCV